MRIHGIENIPTLLVGQIELQAEPIGTPICNTIFQNVVFYARFLFWPIVTFLFVAFYEAFLQDELFGCGQGRSPRLRRVHLLTLVINAIFTKTQV
jgi:hypothetical protein